MKVNKITFEKFCKITYLVTFKKYYLFAGKIINYIFVMYNITANKFVY